MKGAKKKFLMGNFIIKDRWDKQEKDGRTSSGKHITDPRITRMEETNIRQRSMETSSEGGQGPEGAVAP